MIVSKTIEIKIGSAQQRNHFREKGINCNLNDIIKIEPILLSKGSHIKILVKCDNCGYEKMATYSDYLKCLKKENIYFCSKCKRIKTNKTNIEKYGFITNLKCDDTKNKIKKTCLEKYGVENVFQNDIIKEKIKETCLEKYGVKYPTQNSEIFEKQTITNMKKYGAKYFFKTINFKKISEFTKIERYDNKNYTNIEKYKETCLEKYGVEYPIQNSEIREKQLSSSFKIKKYRDLYYQGSYELDFLLNYYDKIKIENINSIVYFYNKKRIYFPDFYLPEYNLIVEIKSDYIYNLHREMNEQKKIGSIKAGYNFLFVMNKKYDELENLILS